jgi:hypothetical protein
VLLHSDLLHALDASLFAREALGLDHAPWQEAVLTTASKRLLLNVTRQGGKSTVAAIKAAHRALYVPGSLVLMVSPSLRQSSELYRKWRELLDRLDQPPSLTQDTSTSATLANRSRVISLPSSESTIRGYSAVDLLLFDEASRVDDALYVSTRPMLAISNGQLVTMSTPAGRRGWWWNAWDSGEGWERVEVPATDCARIRGAFLADERAALGERWYRQEYECSFEETEGALFDYATIAAAITDDIAPLFGGDR